MQELLKKLLFGNAGGGNGGAPSLSLSFTDGGTFDPRITFSRGTNATLTDSNGRVAYAPHNLLTNSEDFEAAAWVKTEVSVSSNVTVAPDGTTTADKFIPSTNALAHWTNVLVSNTTTQCTGTIYVKLDGSAVNKVTMYPGGAATFGQFNLGALTSSGEANVVSTSIQNVGNGWYRLQTTWVAGTAVDRLRIYASSGATGDAFVAGNGTDGIFIWGAQLNITNAPVNLLTWSEDFTNAAWTKRGTCTVTSNAIAAPDGTVTADLISGLNTSGNDIFSTVATVPLNSPASPSFYINKVSATGTLRVGNPSDSAKGAWNVNLALVDSGWQRITLTHPAVTVVTSFVGNGSGDGLIFLAQAGGPLSFYLWGAQLNAGSVALPYVATTSSINVPPTYNSTTPKNLLGFTQEPENAAWTKSNSYVQQNLLLQSNDFQTSWAATNTTRTLNSTASPSGGNDGVKIEATTTAATTLFQGAIVAATSATGSVYVKQGTGATVANAFTLRNSTTATNLIAGTLNYSTGVFTYTTGSTGVNVTNAGNGWWRISFSATSGITSGDTIQFFVGFTGFSITAGDHFFAYGAQLVQGTDAGQYTQTTSAAAVTRYTNWDGTLTGRKLVENTAAASIHLLLTTTDTTVINGTRYTSSLYAKAAERSWIQLAEGTGTTAGAYFNLTTGVVGTVSGTGSPTASIQSVGGGWYRCTLSWNAIGVAARLRAYMATGDGTASYTGDGTSGIYVSDFQLSNSASVDAYVYNPQAAAASAAFYGPRIDYDPVTLASRGLLIEEQRTNLATYSEDFTNAAWNKSRASITGNVAVSPDGATSADKLVEDTTASNTHGINQVFTGTAASYTFTVYAKAGERSQVFLKLFNGASFVSETYFNLSTGAVISGTGGTITNAGNGWYRCSITATLAASANCQAQVFLAVGGSDVYTGDGTSGIFLWGSQVELGAFPTSYIPTVASQVTRNADSASMLGDNFYTWYNPNQGAYFVQASSQQTASVYQSFIQDGNLTLATNGVGNLSLFNGSTYGNVGSTVVGINANTFKAAFGYVSGASASGFAVNNASATSFTNPGISPQAAFGIGTAVTGTGSGARNINGYIRSLRYYTTRLSNATLQQITS